MMASTKSNITFTKAVRFPKINLEEEAEYTDMGVPEKPIIPDFLLAEGFHGRLPVLWYGKTRRHKKNTAPTNSAPFKTKT
jgi:hypothetical protein